MLNILGMIIAIIILFIIILLIFGVRIALIYEKKGANFKGCLNILIFKKIEVYSSVYPDPDGDNDEEDEKEKEKDRDGQKIFELLKPCLEYFKEFVKTSVKCINVVKLENHLVFGLDSYADTGKYIGYIWSLLSIVNGAHKNAMLSAEPSFNGSVFDIKGDNEVDINILKLIPPVIKLMSKKEVRLFIKGVRNGR